MPEPTTEPQYRLAELLRCLDCGAAVSGREACADCGRTYVEQGGIVEALNPLQGRNRIVADFYEGPAWRRFYPFERAFLRIMGGERRARGVILKHLPERPEGRLLEVGIGDGDNLRFLPRGWQVHGVDIARSRLEGCLRRFPTMRGRLALAEAEALPFDDHTFDACLCIGGFTLFGDHLQALKEMRRVTRPGGGVVVADEVPWLCRAGIGHLIGLPRIDAFWMRRLLGLPSDFLDMVFGLRLDVDEVRAGALPTGSRHRIWAGLGYCLVDR